MDNLSVYIPIDRQYALARGVPLPESCRGCALFADISGFTPLTSALAREYGPQRGAEELSRYLNRVFDGLIATVRAYGGAIISFAGDAMTCWFDEDLPYHAAGDADAAGRAAAAASAMQQAMGRIGAAVTVGGTTVTFAIKIALAYGTCRRFLVGDPRIQRIEVLAGALLERMAAAEKHARSGEVVAGAEVVEQLGGLLGVMVNAWRDDGTGQRVAVLGGLSHPVPLAPWPDPPPLSAELASDWILPPIYERLQRGEGDYLAELRSVVALFIKFEGIDYDDDPAAGERLDAYVRWVQAHLARFEGCLLQLTVGDKGSYFYASFGAPLVHEDDPARAIDAALALQAPPAELGYIHSVRIGISQGLMRVGAYGGTLRRVYGVLGSEANVAARLMSMAAPSQLLTTARIAKAVAERYSFDSLGALPVKGLVEPLQVHALAGRRRGQGGGLLKGRAPAPIIGREAELRALAEEIHALREARGARGLVIEAEAGFGKSRLVLELQRQAEVLGLDMLMGAAMAVESRTSHFAWRQVFQQLFGLDRPVEELDGDGRQHWREAILAVLEREQPDLLRFAPLLNTVLPLDLPENEFTAQLSGQVRADNTHSLLVRLLQRRAESAPLLLIFEDGHWLDSASWRLIARVQREVRPLLLVIATRPLDDAAPPESLRLLEAPDMLRMRLGSFSEAEVEALVAQRLGVASLPAPLLELIIEKAEGHPFFSEEIAYSLRDRGLISVVGGECQVDAVSLRGLDFPDTIHGVIASRIDRLTASTQLTLKVASVIGRSFLFRALHAVHPVELDRPHLGDYLSTLERLDITRLEQEEPERAYIFKHVIIQDVAYNMLLFAQRWQLHRLVAEWYERIYAADLSAYYPLLAYHWGMAAEAYEEHPELTDRAIDYLERAGEQALNNFANQEAARFFSQALALDARRRGAAVEQPIAATMPAVEVAAQGRRVAWERQLGESLEKQGHLTEARALYEHALAILGFPLPQGRRELLAGIARQTGRILRRRMRPPARRARSPQSMDLMLEAARLFLSLTPIYYVRNETDKILYAHMHTEYLAAPAGSSPVLAEIYATLAVAMGMVPLHRLARGYAEKAEATARSLGRMSTQAFVNHRVCIYWSSAGELERARRLLEEGMDLSAQLGDWTRWRECAYGARRVAGYRGDTAAAVDHARQLYDSAVRSNHTQHQTWGLAQRALSLSVVGHWDEAITLANQSLALLAEAHIEDTTPMVSAYAALVRAHMARGELAEATRVARAAEQIFPRSSRTHPLYLDVFAAVAELRLRQLDADPRAAEPLAAMQNILLLLQRFARQNKVAEPPYWLYWGMRQWQLGRRREAIRAWHRGLAIAEALGLPVEEGQLRAALGRHLPAGDPDRETQLRRAVAIFERLKIPHRLETLEDEQPGRT